MRRYVAFALLAAAAVAAAAFFIALFRSGPDMHPELIFSWVATVTAVWAVALLVPDPLPRRWIIAIVAGMTVVTAVVLVALVRAVPT